MSNSPVSSFPAHSCLRVSFLPLLTFVAADPERGDWRSAERRHSLVRVAQVTRDATLARRGSSRATGRSASRRSAVALSAQDRLRARGLACGRADAKAPRPPGIAARLRCRAFRIRGYHPRATPHPAPPSGSLLESAPHERDLRHIAQARRVVNTVIITCS